MLIFYSVLRHHLVMATAQISLLATDAQVVPRGIQALHQVASDWKRQRIIPKTALILMNVHLGCMHVMLMPNASIPWYGIVLFPLDWLIK